MKLSKYSWLRGLLYAGIFTIFPYLLGFLLMGWQHDTSGWGIAFFRLVVVIGTPPLWLITSMLPLDNDQFFLYVYPVFSFFAWYLIIWVVSYALHKFKS